MTGRGNSIDIEHLQRNPDALFDLLDSIESDFEFDADEEEDESTFPYAELGSTDESEDEEDSVPLSSFQKLHWRRECFIDKGDPMESLDPNSEVLTPWKYFERYLNDDFFQMGSEFTSQYHLQTKGTVLNVTSGEIKQFFGLHAIMGCMKYPRLHMYWNKKFKFPLVTDVMSRNKFFLLRNNFHVIDNLSIDVEERKKNKLWRVQPMIDLIRNRCRAIERKPKGSYSIDEQMIPFLGRCPVRQYVRNKPRPVGLKNFVMTTSEGIILDFEIYQGPISPFETKRFGLGPSVILRLVETLPEESYVFFDRYFTTVPLMEQLGIRKIHGTGTIMANRMKGADFKKDKDMKRGDSDEFVRSDRKLCVTKWMDNKSVLMLSTAFGVQPESSVKRWDKIRRERVEVTCPKVVSMYNKKMGGVDLADQMIEYYRSFFKTKKWTFKVILHLFDLAVVNSWMEYTHDKKAAGENRTKVNDLLAFRLELGEYLISGSKKRPISEVDPDNVSNSENDKKRSGRTAIPCLDKRYDGFEHWPTNDDLKNPVRCRMEGCESRTRMRCLKCDIYLCITKHKNCFREFHQQ